MIPLRAREILASVIKRDGRFTTQDIENAEQVSEWQEPRPLINARPERMKICPLCYVAQPIAEFIIESDVLRTCVLFVRSANEDFAFPCADISEYCLSCS